LCFRHGYHLNHPVRDPEWGGSKASSGEMGER
jgi:hypothetical protein